MLIVRETGCAFLARVMEPSAIRRRLPLARPRSGGRRGSRCEQRDRRRQRAQQPECNEAERVDGLARQMEDDMLKCEGNRTSAKRLSRQRWRQEPGPGMAHIARCNACRSAGPSQNSGLRVRSAEPDRCRQAIDDGNRQMPRVGLERHDLAPCAHVVQLAGPASGR